MTASCCWRLMCHFLSRWRYRSGGSCANAKFVVRCGGKAESPQALTRHANTDAALQTQMRSRHLSMVRLSESSRYTGFRADFVRRYRLLLAAALVPASSSDQDQLSQMEAQQVSFYVGVLSDLCSFSRLRGLQRWQSCTPSLAVSTRWSTLTRPHWQPPTLTSLRAQTNEQVH